MRPEDRKSFLEVVIGFAELKGKQLSAPGLELYWNAMQDWTIEEFRQAANTLIRTCEFMPTPKEFNDLRKAALPTKGEAWGMVLDHLKGGYRTRGLMPAIDRAVRALGGYRALATMPVDQLPWQERRFAEHYDDMAEADERREPQLLPQNIRKLLGAA
jgi:hypothetical protein